MGWLTGALPALFGRQAIFATIEAVETFVDQHYEQQVVRIDAQSEHALRGKHSSIARPTKSAIATRPPSWRCRIAGR